MVRLYPNTPKEEGIGTMRKYSRTPSDKSVSTNSLCNLAVVIYEESLF